MAKKKDIGTLFENKLKEGLKVPNDVLWEKINSTLDDENRKRRKAIFYWSLSAGVFALLGFLLVFSISMLSPSVTEIGDKNTILSEKPDTNLNYDDDKTKNKVLKSDSISFKNNSEEQFSGIISTSTDSLKNSRIISEKHAKNNIKNTPSKSEFKANEVKVSEKYYYYNSRNGKQVVTEEKSVIDSLILETETNRDSTIIKKKDSLRL